MEVISDKNGDLCGITIFWRIENFSNKVSDKLALWSPVFEIETLDAMWQMKVARENSGLSCYLVEKTCSEISSLRFTSILLTGYGWSVFSENEPGYYRKERLFYERIDFISDEDLKNKEWFYLPNASLTIAFNLWSDKLHGKPSQILIFSKLLNMEENKLHHKPIENFNSLRLEDLLCFLDSYKFQIKGNRKTKSTKTQQTQTDEEGNDEDKCTQLKLVTIRTMNREFVVPRGELSTKSPIFKEMFEKEKDRNIFDIDDVDSDTMSLIINYLLFEFFGDITWNIAEKLFIAAMKYQIVSLKKACVTFFKDKISVENVCHVLIMSDKQKLQNLMCCAQEYFNVNAKVILQSKVWRNLVINNSELATDILHQFAETM